MKNRLKVQRAEHNLSQAKLAGEISMSGQTINSIETGRYVPSTVLALKLAQAFSVRGEEVFHLEDGD